MIRHYAPAGRAAAISANAAKARATGQKCTLHYRWPSSPSGRERALNTRAPLHMMTVAATMPGKCWLHDLPEAAPEVPSGRQISVRYAQDNGDRSSPWKCSIGPYPHRINNTYCTHWACSPTTNQTPRHRSLSASCGRVEQKGESAVAAALPSGVRAPAALALNKHEERQENMPMEPGREVPHASGGGVGGE